MSDTRISRRFAACRDEGRAALVTFVMAGDPDHDTALKILQALPDAGADVIEVGMPFTDPMANRSAEQMAIAATVNACEIMSKERVGVLLVFERNTSLEEYFKTGTLIDARVTEQLLRGSGAAWTFLRDSFYADVLPHFVGDDGVLRGPAGDGRVAAVAQDDVAAAAVAVLRDPAAHAGATYDLTGPEALTLAEVAETITRTTGRAVTYRDETLEEARASRAVYGAPEWQLEAWVSTYTAIAAGELASTSTAVADLTGRPATSLAQLLAR